MLEKNWLVFQAEELMMDSLNFDTCLKHCLNKNVTTGQNKP